MSTVSVSCDVEKGDKSEQQKVCDSFEVGIIGNLDYDMYDIAVMITDTPDELLGKDFATISFRLSHLNDDFMNWYAMTRTFCLLVCAALILLYFININSCSLKKGFNPLACLTFNIDQYWIISLLFLCCLYNEPLFELRRKSPSIVLAVLSEIPASLFLTALLTYWLMGLTLVRVKTKVLAEK